MPRPISSDPDDLARNDELETALSNKYEKDSRETFRVALKRFADSPADVLERIALNCSAAFVSSDDSATGDDRPEPEPHHNERAAWATGRGW